MKMSTPSVSQGENIQSLITKLKSLDVSRVAVDEAAKIEALSLAKKVTATLEDPINRATDLMFSVCVFPIACQDKILNDLVAL